MNRIASRATITLLLALLLVAGFGFFLAEFATQADTWVITEGSPHVYNGSNIGTGVITDRDGTILLDMNEGRTYSQDEVLRKSTVHWIGDRSGSVSAPAVVEYADDLLGYDVVTGVYSYGENGGVAQLTLSAKLQQAALEALGDYRGTVAVYNYKTGQILCSVTTPTFDPDNAPDSQQAETYDGLYLNRFTQGSYIPGSIFKIVTLAAALEEIPDIEEQTFLCEGSYQMGDEDDLITCELTHGTQDLKAAFCNSCNCAFAQISQQLGKEKMEKYVEKFGVIQSITFDGITTQAGNFDISDASSLSVAWSSVGQYKDLVNPCGFQSFVGAVANGGKGVMPYLVEQVHAGDTLTYQAKVIPGDRIMSQKTAQTVAEYLSNNVQTLYGAGNFPGLTVCAKTGTGQVGGDRKPNAMLTGFATDEAYPLAFIVCVEDAGYGSTVCIPIASKVLAACKEAI